MNARAGRSARNVFSRQIRATPSTRGRVLCVSRTGLARAFFSVFSYERHVASVNLSGFSRFVCVFSLVVRKELGVDRSLDWSAC